MLYFRLGKTVSTFLFRIDEHKLSQSCMCGTKLSMFTVAAWNILVHWSCWAGRSANESRGWVNNQLPPLTLSVATKPVDWLLWHKIALLLFISIVQWCLETLCQSVWLIQKPVSHSCYLRCHCPALIAQTEGYWICSPNSSTTSRPGETGQKRVCMYMDSWTHTHTHSLYPYLPYQRSKHHGLSVIKQRMRERQQHELIKREQDRGNKKKGETQTEAI